MNFFSLFTSEHLCPGLHAAACTRNIAKPVADFVKFAKIAQVRGFYINLCLHDSILCIFKLSTKVSFQRVKKLS